MALEPSLESTNVRIDIVMNNRYVIILIAAPINLHYLGKNDYLLEPGYFISNGKT